MEVVFHGALGLGAGVLLSVTLSAVVAVLKHL
jgi:hypothetical protein